MRHLFLLILISISLINCTDEDTPQGIEGTWDWVERSGGLHGDTATPASTGDTAKLVISDSTVKHFLNGDLVIEYNYTISVGQSFVTGVEEDMLIEEGGIPKTFHINDNELILIEECIDCYQSKYVRVE